MPQSNILDMKSKFLPLTGVLQVCNYQMGLELKNSASLTQTSTNRHKHNQLPCFKIPPIVPYQIITLAERWIPILICIIKRCTLDLRGKFKAKSEIKVEYFHSHHVYNTTGTIIK